MPYILYIFDGFRNQAYNLHDINKKFKILESLHIQGKIIIHYIIIIYVISYLL